MAAQWFRAICIDEFQWGDRTYRQGESIIIVDADREELQQAAVIGDVHPVAPLVEMATATAKEDASQNYRPRRR